VNRARARRASAVTIFVTIVLVAFARPVHADDGAVLVDAAADVDAAGSVALAATGSDADVLAHEDAAAPVDAAAVDAGAESEPRNYRQALDVFATPGRVARVVIGLFVLVALAILAGHPRVAGFEKRSGISMFASTGIPFLALGALARLPQVGILRDDVVRDLRPLLEFGLGWIGFRVGSQFDVRELDRLPQGAGRLLGMQSATAFIAASAGSMGALWLVGRSLGSNIIRDGLILGACASVSAPSGARALEAAGVVSAEGSRMIRKIVLLDDVVPIAVLALVTAIFRPLDAATWRLPALGWVFVQIGMGAALGALTVAMMRAAKNINEEIALTLGAIAFAAGMASYLGFSPLAVGCVAGVIVVNLSTEEENAIFGAKLRDLERPIFMVFFAVAGSLWDIRDWRGWAVIPLFVLARLFGKLGGARAAFLADRQTMAEAARQGKTESDADTSQRVARASFIPHTGLLDPRSLGIALIPASAVSIAVVISARHSYPDSIPAWLETIVIVGAIATEVLFQFVVPTTRRGPPGSGPPLAMPPIDAPAESSSRPAPPAVPGLAEDPRT
jgi:Kef-type K+ transport system membrane component KefB